MLHPLYSTFSDSCLIRMSLKHGKCVHVRLPYVPHPVPSVTCLIEHLSNSNRGGSTKLELLAQLQQAGTDPLELTLCGVGDGWDYLHWRPAEAVAASLRSSHTACTETHR